MASKRQVTKANNMLEMIKNNGPINKFDLMDACGISLNEYNQLSAWFTRRYSEIGHIVEYDRKEKSWRWLGKGDKTAIEEAMQRGTRTNTKAEVAKE